MPFDFEDFYVIVCVFHFQMKPGVVKRPAEGGDTNPGAQKYTAVGPSPNASNSGPNTTNSTNNNMTTDSTMSLASTDSISSAPNPQGSNQ